MSTLEQIKNLRERTGAGIVDVKKALEAAGNDETKAIEILRKKGQDKALKKSDREAGEGVIGTYVHSTGKIAVLAKVLCETDFVARNPEFQEFAGDIAMHIAGMSPKYVKPEDVTAEEVEKEKEIWKEQLKNEGKPEQVWDKILEGKERKFREESALLSQDFVKDSSITVGEHVTATITKMGENIQVSEFVRFEM